MAAFRKKGVAGVASSSVVESLKRAHEQSIRVCVSIVLARKRVIYALQDVKMRANFWRYSGVLLSTAPSTTSEVIFSSLSFHFNPLRVRFRFAADVETFSACGSSTSGKG